METTNETTCPACGVMNDYSCMICVWTPTPRTVSRDITATDDAAAITAATDMARRMSGDLVTVVSLDRGNRGRHQTEVIWRAHNATS